MAKLDSYLAQVKKYGLIFLAGFGSGLAANLLIDLINGRFDVNVLLSLNFYIDGLAAGFLYLLSGLIDDGLRGISFMDSFYRQMEPVYYSLVAPVLLLAILGIVTPLKALIKSGKIGRLFQGVFSKFQNLVVFYMIRMCIDSLCHFLHGKYLSGGQKYVSIGVFVLCAGASAFAAAYINNLLGSKVLPSAWRTNINPTDDAILMAAFTLMCILITDEYRILPYSRALL